MADDFYEPNASNIMGVGQAIQQGNQLSQSFGNSMDQGAQMQQQIVKTQMMKQQLQQQMEDNQLNMTNHLLGQMGQLAYYGSNSPQGKVISSQLTQKLGSMGMQVDQDSLKSIAMDDDDRNAIQANLSNWNKLSPDQQKQAMPMLRGIMNPDQFVDWNKNMAEINARAQMFQNRQDINNETNLSKRASAINANFQKNQSFFQTANDTLQGIQSGKLQTGQAEGDLKLALARAFQGGVPRSAQLQMMSDNRSLTDQVEGYFQKLQTGKRFQPDELNDFGKLLTQLSSDSDKNRLKLLLPIYNSAQSYGSNLDNVIGSKGDQASLEMLKNAQNMPQSQAPPPFPKAKKGSAPTQALTDYEPNKDAKQDIFVKNMAANGVKLSDANKVLQKYKLKISPSTWSILGGK